MSADVIFYDWTPDSMLEVLLPSPDNFLKVKETLTRIGVASRKDKKLYQSCHILHKQGHYYIVHFKELFILDRKDSTISVSDVQRRDAIAVLLEDWGLLTIVNKPSVNTHSILSQVKIVSYKEKSEWELIAKYSIGQRKRTGE
jgi:hypothetical protein